MDTKELINSILIPLGISGGASVVRAIFVPQEGSAWDKFLKISGSMLFGAGIGALIRHTETSGWLLRNVDYIIAVSALVANEIVTGLVKKLVAFAITYVENKFIKTNNTKKGEVDGN